AVAPAAPPRAVSPPPGAAERDAALARAVDAEAALAESRRALASARRDQETALAAIGHDMRTPMQSVLGICDLLLDGALEDDQRRWVEQLHASGAALLALLNGLLAIAGGGASQVAATNLAELLEGAASLFAAEAESRGVVLSLRVDPALGGVWSVDSARLRQIVVNLLANAVARTDHGTVTLRAVPEAMEAGHGVRISVRDTGPGIAAADQARIFARFERGDGAGAAGLGLALCRENAAAMGAVLTVDSKPGEGATFTLICAAEPVPPDARRNAFAGRNALIVGLNETARTALAVQLEALGFAVEAAPDGFLGLALAERTVARSGVLDVVVLDLAQTAMPAEAFCLRLRASGFGRSVVLLGLAEDPQADRPPALDSVMRRGASASEIANAVARLLADQPAMSALLPTSPAGAAVSGGRVLIVEDDETNRALLGAALTRNGFTAFPAANGEEAVRMAEHDGLDAVLVDLVLPGIDGLETARRIRALPGRSATIPIVALTARAGEAVEAECRAAGLTAMVGKPTDLDQLAQRLRGWIAATPRGAIAAGADPMQPAAPAAQVSEPFLEAMVSEIGLERTRACLQEFLDEAASKTVRLGELIPGWESGAMLRLCDDLKGLADLFGAVGFSETIEELGAATEQGARAEAAGAMQQLEEGLPLLPEAMWAALSAIERRRAERDRRAA
ncbi:MAG: response regulator, partial [Rhodospirillales bacterium]|nr:response regulator [Rhodospirillales bacterium]